jgi:hypothetical protein
MQEQSQQPRDRFNQGGIFLDEHLILPDGDKSCVNSALFREYIKTVFLSCARYMWNSIQFIGERAFRLMNDCVNRVSPVILRLLGDAQMR